MGQPILTPSSSREPSDPPTTNGKQGTPPANGTANGSAGLNARSCTTCRKRKVKCDKRHPCSNCTRAGIECIFPGPGRAPRRSRKPPDTELLARLRRLEGVVQSLGKGIDDEAEPANEPVVVPKVEYEPLQPNGPDNFSVKDVQPHKSCGLVGQHEPKRANTETSSLIKEFGRLQVENGKSRYVSNKFWNSLSDEVAEMRDILDDDTEEEDDYPSPGSGSSASGNHHQGFLFSFSSTILSLRRFHPIPEQISIYWAIFKTNIDPVIKLLHVPHYEKMISQASLDLDHISKPIELLMFTIYFAATTTLSPDDCILQLGMEKHAALRKYRFAVEQALARAGFLNTQELVVLQSMLLFLTCVRRSDETRYVWTLTGLLIRLAQGLGVHRDGQQFGLSPFETEMRRRLWWQISSLDNRASEDQGSDPSIVEQSFDTKFPLNINDEDIDPSMKETPKEHEGATQMTFDLIRYSMGTTVRRLTYAPAGEGRCKTMSASQGIEDKERMIDNLHQYLERKYLQHCDMSVPLHWVAATVARLILAKMWLVVHHPFSRLDAGAGLPQETKDRLFCTSLEVIEFSRLLETEKTTLRWGWLFRTYVQWHALAFVLSQLCTRTIGSDVDKAWMIIEAVFENWGGNVTSNQRGMLWKPLRKLMAKARLERSKALEKQARFPLDGSLGPNNPQSNLPQGPVSTGGPSQDCTTFEMPELINDTLPATTTDMNSLNGLQQPFVPVGQPQFTGNLNGTNSTDQWNFDPSVFAQDRLIEENDVNWTGWDDMIKDYQMEMESGNGQSDPAGPQQDGNLMSWW
ncbi:MAG: hypothetical protein ASARMPRED_006024 [Alectoria sarmentosa]|nr:MAG: hypothetical protein ASARMPRED_006024 [Alectoria sarmentosa]